MKTALKAIRLLRALAASETDMGVNELARGLAIDPATVHRLLKTFQAEGLVSQDEKTRKYRLGFGVLELASGLLRHHGIVGVAMPFLEKLHAETEETVSLDARHGAAVVCLAALNCPQEVRTTNYVGERMPLHCTSAGQIFLTYMEPDERKRHLLGDLPRYTPKTIVEPTQLNKIFAEISRSGIAVSDESYHHGVRGISAPVFAVDHAMIAAISITIPKQRLTLKQMAALSSLVKATAGEISSALKRLDAHGSLRPKFGLA